MHRLLLAVSTLALSGLGCSPFVANHDVPLPPQVEMKIPLAKLLVTADETNDQNAKEKARLLEMEIADEMRTGQERP